jgi:hypothetical protein
VYQGTATASFGAETTRKNARETTHKESREQTEKLSSEIKRSFTLLSGEMGGVYAAKGMS